jgi:predicted metalloprotease
MRWDRGYRSNDIEDRRGEGGGGGFGGGGAGIFGLLRIFSMFGWKGIVVGLIIAGVIASRGMCGGATTGPSTTTSDRRQVQSSAQEDELVHFIGFVFDDVQKSWHKRMPDYQDSKLVLFRNAIRSACGTASSAVGPFYCPIDRKVYIDLGFYEELRRRFGAPGDFAQAYVIAHELGHHVQNQLHLMGKGAPDSIHVELQADCLAGAWGQDANGRGLLEIGDVDEALNAAAQIGDDTLQKKTTGHVQPETWTHGSSAQRVANFKKGYEGGAKACGI